MHIMVFLIQLVCVSIGRLGLTERREMNAQNAFAVTMSSIPHIRPKIPRHLIMKRAIARVYFESTIPYILNQRRVHFVASDRGSIGTWSASATSTANGPSRQ